MSVSLFISFLVIASALNTLVTEAVKKAYENAGLKCSPNVVALINAFAIGGCGTAASYIILGLPWNATNILALVGMIACVWVGSMIGFDRIIQTLKQIADVKEENEKEEK